MPIISQITAFQPGPFFEKLLHKSQEEINYTKYVQGIEWNKRNQIHDKLMKEMRAYWVNKWFGEFKSQEELTEIENIITEMTTLPEDVIGLIVGYLPRRSGEYPYQVKYI